MLLLLTIESGRSASSASSYKHRISLEKTANQKKVGGAWPVRGDIATNARRVTKSRSVRRNDKSSISNLSFVSSLTPRVLDITLDALRRSGARKASLILDVAV